MSELVSAIQSNFQNQPSISNKLNIEDTIIKAFVITMINDHSSTVAARKCIQSIKNTKSLIDPYIEVATTPFDLNDHLNNINLDLSYWSYPKSPAETRVDIKTGLKITGYRATDYTKVVSCFVSHARLWGLCIQLNEPIMILEHDAIFTKKFNYKAIQNSFTGGVIGLNDPRGATRKSQLYHQKVIEQQKTPVVDVPWIDNEMIPQGIAGNSAYIIRPDAAKHLIDKIKSIGMWPNDALMCKQLFPWLQQAYPYYTTVQGLKSSTTL